MAAHQAPPYLGFSGKDTGVGCHFLLQCMKVKSESEVTQSCLTLCDPMDCSLPGSSVHQLFQAKSTGVGCHCLLWQRMIWLDSITDSMDTDLSKFRETVQDSGAWYAAIHGVTKSRT